VSAHTKAIVVGRQIDRKIVGIPFQQESCPTIDRAWCTMRVRTFTDYPVGDPYILCVQWLSASGSSEEATEAVPPQIKLNKKKIKNIIFK
jgi:hypothetical protein